MPYPPCCELGASTEDGSGKDGSTNEVAYAYFFILTTRFIVESGEYELIAFFFLVRCYEQLWCSILGLRCGSNHDKEGSVVV